MKPVGNQIAKDKIHKFRSSKTEYLTNTYIPDMLILCQLLHTPNPNIHVLVLLWTYFSHCIVYLSKVWYILLMFVMVFFCMETGNIAYMRYVS